MRSYILGSLDELVRFIPVAHEVGCFSVPYPQVVVLELTREEVVYFARDVQDVAHTAIMKYIQHLFQHFFFV